MIFRNVRVYGLENSFRVSKFPMSANHLKCDETYTPRIKSLANAKGGSGHDNFLKGIIVQFDFTATNKIWVEAERYNFFDIVSSQSTMHKLKDMKLDECFIKYTDKRIVEIMKELQKEFNEVNTKDSTAEERKEAFYNLVYSCPSGLLITAGISTNYLQLKTMYHQRKGHYLDEWSVDFVKFVNSLPYSDLITGEEEYKKIIESGDKRALAHFKIKHGYTMTKEEQDILNEDRVENPPRLCDDFDGDFDTETESKAFQKALQGIKTYAEKKDECEGCTCYQFFTTPPVMCSHLTKECNVMDGRYDFTCNKKQTGISIPFSTVCGGMEILPGAFNGEEF